MIQLRTLGSLDLRTSDGGELRALLVRPKRFALLLYLALASPRGFHRRDRLLAVFWPELDQARARGALNQSLHILRRALGDGVILRRGDEEVAVCEAWMECDALIFEHAVVAKRFEEALAIYRGEFLDAFHLKGAAPEFDQWLESERDRLKTLAIRAAAALVASAEERGEASLALHWATRAAALAPYDEEVFRRRMLILRRRNDMAGALLAYEEFSRRLERDLGLCPSDTLASLARDGNPSSVPDRIAGTTADGPLDGHSADVGKPATATDGNNDGSEWSDSVGKSRSDPQVGAEPHRIQIPGRTIEDTAYGRTTRSPRGKAALAVAVLSTIFLTLVGSWYAFETIGGGGGEDFPLDRSIVVLPFESVGGDEAGEVFAAGFQGAITAQLTKVSDIIVVRDQRTAAREANHRSLASIGAELGVGRALEGRVEWIGDRVWISAQLVDTRTGQYVWADQYEYSDTAGFTIRNTLALAIAEALRARITSDERQRLARVHTESREAFAYFSQGLEYQLRVPGPAREGSAFGLQEILSAAQLYKRALELDPDFALARAHLAQVHGELYFFGYDPSPRRREMLRVEALAAARSQPDLPEARLAMGYYWYLAEKDYDRALAEFELARAGLPNNPLVWMMIANVHRRKARWQEALFAYERAFRLDPQHSDKALNLARTYLAMGRYREAARTWDAAIAIDPDNYQYEIAKARVFLHGEGNADSLGATLRRMPADYDPNGTVTLARTELAHLRRRPADAVAGLNELLHRDEGAGELRQAWFRTLLAQSYEAQGDSSRAREHYEAARVTFERLRRLDPAAYWVHARLGLVYAGLGRPEDAVAAARRAVRLLPVTEDAWTAPWLLVAAAETYARIGAVEAAMETLAEVVAMPNELVTFHTLRLEPRWDLLRHEPGFRSLLASARR